jgi:hypothetical protein
MKRSLVPAALTACAALAAAARAQSFNVEWEVANPNGTWTGAPSASFDGAADQSGTWNTLTTNANATNLTSVAGAASPVDLTLTNATIFSIFDDPDLSGDLDRLLGDTILCSAIEDTMSATFSRLLKGRTPSSSTPVRLSRGIPTSLTSREPTNARSPSPAVLRPTP